MAFRKDPNPLRVAAPDRPDLGAKSITRPPRLDSRRSQSTGERRKTIGDILLGAAQGPLSGIGIFQGRDGTDFEWRAGDPAGQFIHWTGSVLNITGSITATSGAIGGWVISANAITSGNVIINSLNEQILFGSAISATSGTGIFLGLDTTYQFRIGDPLGTNLLWDATNLTLTGTLIASALIISGDTQITGDLDIRGDIILQTNATQLLTLRAGANGTSSLVLEDAADVGTGVSFTWDGSGPDQFILSRGVLFPDHPTLPILLFL